MKKLLSLFGLLGLLAFVAAPIYAQEEAVALEDEGIIAEAEDISIDDELDYGINEDGYEWEANEDIYPDYSDYDWSNYDSDYDISYPSNGITMNAGTMALLGGLGIAMTILFYLAFIYGSLFILSLGEIYRKAGKKLWAFLIPFWGTMQYSEIAGMNKWLGLLPWLSTICGFLPGVLPAGIYSVLMIILGIVSLVWLVVANYRVARRYDWGVFASILHAIIILCPITVLVLGLGNYQYQGQVKKEPETIVEA